MEVSHEGRSREGFEEYDVAIFVERHFLSPGRLR